MLLSTTKRASSRLISVSHWSTRSSAHAGVATALARGFVASRRLQSSASSTSVVDCLYRYEICPFCNKVEAVLGALGMPPPQKIVEVQPLNKRGHPQPMVDGKKYRKVPVADVDGLIVPDSARIVDTIAERAKAAAEAAGDAELKTKLANFFHPDGLKWAAWSDAKLAVLLFPNITRSLPESWNAFSYVWRQPDFSVGDKVACQVIGAAAMWAAQGKIKRKYSIEDEREALRTALNEWMGAVGTKPFVLGDRISVGDAAVYGALRAVAGMPVHGEILEADAPLAAWYGRVALAVNDNC